MTFAVVLFGVGFLCEDRYEKQNGSGIGATIPLLLLSNFAGLLILLAVNRFHIEFTLFTLLVAAAAATCSLLYGFCSLKALSKINLSLYSLFAMLGGMMLPFLAGLIFYREPMTLGKGLCVGFIVAALALTVRRDDKKGGTIYYIGVFVCNGMSGILTKIFLEAPYEKTNAASYSMWIAMITMTFAAVIAVFLRKRLHRPNRKAIVWGCGCGAFVRIANYLLVLALAVLPASVQYPFVTGGTMIVSTLLGYAVGQHPSRRELVAVGLSFLGVLILVLI